MNIHHRDRTALTSRFSDSFRLGLFCYDICLYVTGIAGAVTSASSTLHRALSLSISLVVAIYHFYEDRGNKKVIGLWRRPTEKMYLSNLLLPALALLAGIQSASAKAIITNLHLNRRTANSELLSSRSTESSSIFDFEHQVEKRNPAAQSSSTASGLDSICATAISHLGSPTNPAGLLACYDVVALDTKTGSFQSTVQIYQAAVPSGNFTGVNVHSAILNLQYPAAFLSALTRRSIKQSTRTLSRSRSTITTPQLIVSKSFAGELSSTLALSSLNTTELISLLIPSISIEALSPQSSSPVFTKVANTDIAFFPTGVFSRTQHAVVAPALAHSSAVASQAMADAAVFVLPGVSLGIFPTGLIVTGSWAVLFLGFFGFGTLGRIRHQKQFRNRIANPRFGSR